MRRRTEKKRLFLLLVHGFSYALYRKMRFSAQTPASEKTDAHGAEPFAQIFVLRGSESAVAYRELIETTADSHRGLHLNKPSLFLYAKVVRLSNNASDFDVVLFLHSFHSDAMLLATLSETKSTPSAGEQANDLHIFIFPPFNYLR